MRNRTDQEIKAKLGGLTNKGNYDWPVPEGWENLIGNQEGGEPKTKEDMKTAGRFILFACKNIFFISYERLMRGYKGKEYVRARSFLTYALRCLGFSNRDTAKLMRRKHSSVIYIMCYFLKHHRDQLGDIRMMYQDFLDWKQVADEINQYSRIKRQVRRERKKEVA